MHNNFGHYMVFFLLQKYKVVLYVADVGQGTAIVIEVQETSVDQVQNGASFINVILYSRKFLQGPNFHDFCDPRPKRDNKNLENLNT